MSITEAEKKIDEAQKSLDEAEAILAGKVPAKPIEIVLILDRSGSMQSIRSDAEGGINELLKKQKTIRGAVFVTLAQFDTEYEVIHSGTPLFEVEQVRINPRGCTALLDAIGRTIEETEKRLVNFRDRLVAVCIVTDGMENASTKWSLPNIKALIDRKTAEGWEFIFLAANQDAIQAGSGMGIDSARSVTCAANAEGTRRSYMAVSQNLMSFRATGLKSALDFSDDQRSEALGKDD